MKRDAWALLLCAAIVVWLQASVATAQEANPPKGSDTVASDADAAQNPERGGGGGFVASVKNWAEEHQLSERLSGDIDGWYPRLGGMTRGAGFSLGPGYRLHVGDVLVDVSAGMSIRQYKAVDARIRWFQALDEKFALWTDYRFEDFPQEDFWGMGPDSLADARTSYLFRSHDVVARGVFSPVPWMRTGLNVGYMLPTVRPGRDQNYPSIGDRFTDVDAPGLGTQPDYLHTTLFADVDTRDARGHPRSGGLYRAAFGIWNARDASLYDFRRLDLNAAHYVPLVPSKDHLVLGRIGIAYVNNALGDRVPFYFLPYVGGVDTVRSLREFRLKDENAIWMTAEYNYRPMKWFSVAAFADGGKVAHDWDGINFTNLRKGYGVGVRVHNRRQTFLRVDYARGGGEGSRIFFKLGMGS